MFDIPELDDLICQQLSQHDLAQCAQVNRTWHTVVIPYLWRDLTCIQHNRRRDAFRRIVLDDYLHKQRLHRDQGEENDMDQHTQESFLSSVSVLERYGPWIRELPDPMRLFECLQLPNDTWTQQLRNEHIQEPTTLDLLRDLYKRCPAIQVQNLCVSAECLNHDGLLETISDLVVPGAHSLYIKDHGSAPGYVPRQLKYLLTRAGALEKLTLSVGIISHDEVRDNEMDDETSVDDTKPWSQLDELELIWCADWTSDKAIWPWLWKRCHHVEKLKVCNVNGTILQNLAESMSTHMPNLSQISLGQDDKRHIQSLKDREIATLLSGCSRGWKVVLIKPAVAFGEAAVQALERHYPTLEVFDINARIDSQRNELVRVLSSSPNLRALISPHNMWSANRCETSAFIDRDPATGALKVWACETSLKILKVVINGIPRHDLRRRNAEIYPGQEREIQGQVYDRLARLTSLETLWLGADHDSAPYIQWDCLEMSLESGLHKLSGLKALEELNVSSMAIKIGVPEVQWMTQHWPRLRVICGLREDRGKEAVKWLREHHPQIEVNGGGDPYKTDSM
ncbi:MAG: hypothetical protein J3Q66DRAFT_350327 [Benniella sp.]|nr:MAG: hypothetical protein J3Q66DRAFT_350327 [Benniella sp.]